MATVDKQVIVATFGQAAAHYEQHVGLQRQSADALLAMLPQRKYTHVLDVGCGPGWMSRRQREHHTQVTALGLSPPMLVQTRRKDTTNRYPAGDIESLSLATTMFDFAWSNLAVRWCGNLSMAPRELYQVVCPGGVVTFTTLVQGSLPELHQARQTTDGRPCANHFLPPDKVEQSLDAVCYQHYIQPIALWFDDALSAMRSLKDTGATHLHEGRNPRILTCSQLQRLQLTWPQQQGRCPLTYHFFLGAIARK